MAFCQGLDGVCEDKAEVPYNRMFERCENCKRKAKARNARWAQERADKRGGELLDGEVDDIMADL